MLTLLLLLSLTTQGIPVLADQSGTVTGIIKDAGGKAAPGIRVGAIAVPESAADIAAASAMVSLAATDENGRYRLENIPPGRYYIAAGRVDFPTYYPGTTALARGTVISITPKVVVENIDFAMQDSSARVAVPDRPGVTGNLSFSLPIRVAIEGGAKLPVFSPSGFVVIRLANISNGIRTDVPINAATTPVPSPTSEFRVSIENLPPGYGLKSITAGSTDIKVATLRLSALTFAPSAVPNTPMFATIPLSVTLTAPPAARASSSGVRVTGKAADDKRRSIYLSGKPGTFYSDGTFEFRDVPPGRYTVATIENPETLHPLGAAIVVGNRDVEGVQLNEIALLPEDIRTPTPQAGDTSNGAGASVRLALLRVALVDEQTREPAGPGTVYLLGPLGTSFDLPSNGKFEFPRLLPGKYNFEIQVFRHKTITRTIVIDDTDVELMIGTEEL